MTPLASKHQSLLATVYNDAVLQVVVGDVTLGDGQPLALIAGPCVIESESHALDTASAVREIADRCGVPLIFKASFDKANRTSISSFRGPGLQEGLRVLDRVKREIGVPILTDIHEPSQAAPVAEIADVLQIPAFLSRQTDLLVAAAATGRVVNVKKGQFLAPSDVQHIINKITSTGHKQIVITERGTSFGYNNLVVDMRTFPILRKIGFPVVFDVTHSVQLPGSGHGISSGQAEYIPTLAAAGVAAGIDALFMEVHQTPHLAKSDGANALALDRLEPLLRYVIALAELSHPQRTSHVSE
jgi:2-dehydro-3-deoxyphosphooctonate aldolase (KDO 8-P synthase)